MVTIVFFFFFNVRANTTRPDRRSELRFGEHGGHLEKRVLVVQRIQRSRHVFEHHVAGVAELLSGRHADRMERRVVAFHRTHRRHRRTVVLLFPVQVHVELLLLVVVLIVLLLLVMMMMMVMVMMVIAAVGRPRITVVVELVALIIVVVTVVRLLLLTAALLLVALLVVATAAAAVAIIITVVRHISVRVRLSDLSHRSSAVHLASRRSLTPLRRIRVLTVVITVHVELIVILVVAFQLVLLLLWRVVLLSKVHVVVVVVHEVLIRRVRIPSTVLSVLHHRRTIHVVTVAIVVVVVKKHRRVRLVLPLVVELRLVSRPGQTLVLALPVHWQTVAAHVPVTVVGHFGPVGRRRDGDRGIRGQHPRTTGQCTHGVGDYWRGQRGDVLQRGFRQLVDGLLRVERVQVVVVDFFAYLRAQNAIYLIRSLISTIYKLQKRTKREQLQTILTEIPSTSQNSERNQPEFVRKTG